ncbi:uncharacterized protein LOC125739860 [Brienomyrus brachyistius]|uniref:uncharacterized protein LOC125739860 n=1 Tax=Brienomyrus brachyistius TaxID=42636 RepID=UPI0020B3748F|nr:uncharacterized protein LOC125739860 [Brienomyrus brachyistius]
MDPLMLLFLLIAGLTGADSVSSVGEVSVQRGGSVTIPCSYEDSYKTHVKYWCRRGYRYTCTPIVHTDSPQTKGKVSIRDDPDQRVFTVTMNNLTAVDSGSYWCGVENSRNSAVGTQVYLSVTEGSPGLSVDKQEVTGVEGDSVTVQCRYTDSYSQKQWCKVRRSCVSSSSGLDGRPVLIRDDKVKKVFSVTMRGLERKDTGWYWCDDDRYQQIPVHITVSLRTATTTSTECADSVSSVGSVSVQSGGSVTIPCSYEDRYKAHVKYCCRDYYSSDPCTPIVRSDSLQKRNEVSIRDYPDQRVFTVTMNSLTTGDSDYYWCGVGISGGAAVGTWIQLSVTEGVSTLNTVSVQRGGSVTIPCSYDERYKTHVKYWCNGSDWSSCTPIVRSDSTQISGEVSIIDDPDQRVFNVTMNNLTATGSYWCGVDITGGAAVGTRVYLSVTEGVSTLNMVSVQRGGSVAIPCFYDNMYQQHVKYWCNGSDWSSCTPKVRTDSTQISGEVSIRDDPDQRVFNVTMNNLKPGDSGSYWCGVEISRGSAVGTRVYLSVSEGSPELSVDKQEVTGVEGDSVTVQCRYTDSYSQKRWCKVRRSCVSRSSGLDGRPVLITDDKVKKVFSVTMRGLERKDTGWYWCDTGNVQIPVHITVSLRTTTTTSTERADSVSSVRWVSVQRGGSVTIPCFYNNRYQQHVKYWCRWAYSHLCTPIVRSDSPQTKDDVSIRDDPNQRVFTVSMNNLQTGDSDYYWCGVQISRGSAVGTWMQLSVTAGVSRVNTVSVQRGGSVTIPCYYDNMYQQHVKYWCNGSDWSSCTPKVRSDSPQISGEVSIRDDPDQRVFNVTMNNLTAGDSGSYWCGVEISRGSAVGTRVYLSVTEGSPELSVDKQEVTGVEGDSVTVQCRYTDSYSQKRWCKVRRSCVSRSSGLDGRPVLIRDDKVKKVFSVTMRGLERKDTGWYWCDDDGYWQIPVHITVSLRTTTTTSTERADSVSSVRWVSVQRGRSVTIPCFYNNRYQQHVKYWCRSAYSHPCTPIVRSDSPQTKDDVSIRDYPDQRVFTVTMNNLTAGDSDYYWCGVEISRGSAVGTWMQLSVTAGVSTLNTVTVHRGGSVTIPCFYDNMYQQYEKYWCKGNFWSSCTPIVHTDSTQISGEVSIRDDPDQRVFKVTMNNLTAVDSGSYWCGVEISRGSAVGTRVSLSVTEGVSTLNMVTVQRGGSVTIPCSYDNIYQKHVKYWCKGSDWSSCTRIVRSDSPQTKGEVSIRDDPDQPVFTVIMNNLTAVDFGSYWCGVEISRGSVVGTRVSLSVTEGVSTLNTVTVQRGGSVTIPCYYDNMYQQHVKYWCRGSDWSSCTPIVHSDSTQISGEVSIRDDPDQRVFNVTMNKLTTVDSGTYWCGVEISGGAAVGTRVYLSVTEGVSTLNTVTVHRGGSVTVPCYYDNMYQKHVKYWCKGSDWSSCTPIVRTDSPKKSGDVSIRDDPNQRVFNVTMNNLTAVDSGYYWCGVDISGGAAVGTRVSLSVTEGVSTVNTVSVQRGGSVTIPCPYGNIHQKHVKYWCNGSDWSSCTPIVRTDSPKKNGEVSIRDDPVKPVFTVTMNNLRATGYYWCGVDISGGAAVGTRVSLSVTEGVSTLNTVSVQRGGNVTITCYYDDSYKAHVKYWCRGSDWSSCTPIVRTDSPKISSEVSIRVHPDQRVFNVTMNNLTAVDSGTYWCGVEISRGSAVGTQVYLSVTEDDEEGGNNEKQSLFLYVGLGSLVLLLIIIIITWKVWDKRKKKRAMNQNAGSTELTLNPDHEYAVIDRTGITKGDPAEQASVEPGADVTYSSILLPDPQVSSRCSSHRPAVTPASDVVYSSVTLKDRETDSDPSLALQSPWSTPVLQGPRGCLVFILQVLQYPLILVPVAVLQSLHRPSVPILQSPHHPSAPVLLSPSAHWIQPCRRSAQEILHLDL